MRIIACPSLPLGLLVISMLGLLIGSVGAHEDPAEAEMRSQRGNVAWIQNQYLEKYYLKSNYPKPLHEVMLAEYPRSITANLNALQKFGTPSWNPHESVISKLAALESGAKSLLVGAFHPNLVASQPKAVRDQHHETFKQLVDWMNRYLDDIANFDGRAAAEEWLARYKRIRDLAVFGKMFPHA